MEEFVQGWLLLDTLGEGRFGEVKLLMNKESREMVAVKVLVMTNVEMEKQVKKEICIHRALSHPNVINFFGNRRCGEIEYLFLEYAAGGELFERIEPDIGMEKTSAFKYFAQLLTGVEYLHQKGIVHRDIKPENLLLDANENIKLSDFGMATLFRHNGKERQLNQMCGSVPYMAPEMLANRPHRAEPIDLWSCGIVLMAMLTGELPWIQATDDNSQYHQWSKGTVSLHVSPWTKVDNLTLSLVKGLLASDPAKRYGLKQIRAHRCYRTQFENKSSGKGRIVPSKRHCSSLSQPNPQISQMASSQKTYGFDRHDLMEVDSQSDPRADLVDCANWNSFSQPNKIEDMFLSTQSQMEVASAMDDSGSMSQGTRLYLQVVKRLTRFFISAGSFDHAVKMMKKAFEDLGYPVKSSTAGQFTINLIDRNRIPLLFKCSVNRMSRDKILVDFRLSKGDGIEFKRHFLNIKHHLKPVIKSGVSALQDLN